ncbi:hypothetical protein CBR_g352 [Chara braunii]|uniref:CCHC-type domain-containing protein n=1 Tax=Chara braunii TaxID=69332 RepID=A0A388JQG0_CHABU|nr:hypothetical protein CBR_g352 [Chara braunii]|eukprot:GBG60021.1 hypothetical protein CBR_g352 [Chara braunii]
MAGYDTCHFCKLPGHFIRECPFRGQPNGAEMAARIQGSLGGGGRSDGGGLLPAPSSSNAIVPYVAPQNKGYANSNYNGGQDNGGQRYSRPWNGGYRDRERDRDEKIDRLYALMSEQIEEQEKQKHEAAKLELLQEEKKRLQAEEDKWIQAAKDREQQEARLGHIVRSSVKAVCESALGRKVDIPEDEDEEVVKLRKEEKEALLKKKDLESEQERLRQEIAELKSRQEKGKGSHDVGKEDGLLAMQLQIQELNTIRSALEEKNAELSSLKTENSYLRKEFRELREEVVLIRGKRDAPVVTESSPLEEPAKGKQKADSKSTAMYTPKDLEALQKSYKQALAAKEMALREAEMAKERMARMGVSRIQLTARKALARKTTPRNLRTSFQAVEVGSDEEEEEQEGGLVAGKAKTRPIVEVAHDLEETRMNKFREVRMKEMRQARKADMEIACAEEGISYIKLDQARTDVAEIRARRDFDGWLKDRDRKEGSEPDKDEDDPEQSYATSTEDVHEG